MTRLGCIAAAVFSAVLGAQTLLQPQNPSAAPATTFKNRAPVSKEILKVTLPRPKDTDLPNGVHLLVLEDHRAPLVYFRLIIEGAGGYFDPAGSPGLASFTATLMREGTTSRSSEQLSQDLDRPGATLTVNAETTALFATIVGNALSVNLDAVLRIMSDVVQHPSFADDEIARFKTRMDGQLTALRAQPRFLAGERLGRAVYGNHPGSRVSLTPESVQSLTREALVAFHHAHYVPDRAVLAISGDITLEQARAKVGAAFAGWNKSGAVVAAPIEPPVLTTSSTSLITRPGSVQTTLVVGTQAIDRNDPDYDALTVANRVFSDRLMKHLRQQKGYTYGARSSFYTGLYRGMWHAATDVRTDVTGPALTDLLAEIAQMRDRPVPDEELANIKRAIVASFAQSLENSDSVLSNYVEVYRFKLPVDYWDLYPDRIDKVTAADVQRTAKQYWSADRLQVVAVGDAEKVRPALQNLGTVQEFDANGRPIKE